MKKSRLIPLLLLLALLCCLLTLRIPNPELGTGRSEDIPAPARTGARPPSGGTCRNIHQVYPDNPFSGWPVDLFTGDWRSISTWFCDPTYFRGYTHWGLDFGARQAPASAGGWRTIDGAGVYFTADRGVVIGEAHDGGEHWGMGNHVITLHVNCTERCGTEGEPEDEGQYIYVQEHNYPECYDPHNPTAHPDLVLDCVTDWWRGSYFHFRSTTVQVGDLLERGDLLGYIDSTGRSTGPHLHYQINSPTAGAIDPAPTICSEYNPWLRSSWPWERTEMCPDY